MKNLPATQTQHQIETLELELQNARTAVRLMETELKQAQARATIAEDRRRRERERHDEERKMFICGISALGCIGSAIACFVAAPWWTAIAPAVFACYSIWKAGW